ncbi:MAG: hypothetical protein Kow00121_46050 [Elainellaceae cyanobacterium]
MDFKYRWKNGAPPTRDQAARSENENLLDETQFNDKKDHQMAEDMARKQLNVPTRTADSNRSILPQADSGEQADVNKP